MRRYFTEKTRTAEYQELVDRATRGGTSLRCKSRDALLQLMLHSVSSLTRSTIKQALDEFIRSISASKVGSGGVSQSRNGRERAIRRLAGDVELVALGIR